MIDVYPVKFEAYEDDHGVFVVEAVDECAATVKITTIVNAESWDEISSKIRECLVSMKLNQDEV